MHAGENHSTPLAPVGSPFHSRDDEDTLRPESRDADRDTRGGGRPSIVVGIDGSAESRAALHWAIEYADAIDAKVDAVAVWHQPIQFGISAQPPTPNREFAAAARRWLTDALPETAQVSVPVHAQIEHGDATSVLLDHARRADLLVLGNKGRGVLACAMLGSVAQRCAQHARCPVVLVPTARATDRA